MSSRSRSATTILSRGSRSVQQLKVGNWGKSSEKVLTAICQGRHLQACLFTERVSDTGSKRAHRQRSFVAIRSFSLPSPYVNTPYHLKVSISRPEHRAQRQSTAEITRSTSIRILPDQNHRQIARPVQKDCLYSSITHRQLDALPSPSFTYTVID